VQQPVQATAAERTINLWKRKRKTINHTQKTKPLLSTPSSWSVSQKNNELLKKQKKNKNKNQPIFEMVWPYTGKKNGETKTTIPVWQKRLLPVKTKITINLCKTKIESISTGKNQTIVPGCCLWCPNMPHLLAGV